ncbi:MAG: DNA polymerase III subunit beta [Bacteroides sp.]|nr:DNA polymerase III subunit beta [Bacteroides sp.]
MKFNVPGKALQTQLQAVSKVINSKNTMGILDNFLLRVKDDVLTILGGDQEMQMTATLEIFDVDGEGAIAIGAKRLLEVVKEISNQPLTFDIDTDTGDVDLRFNNGHFNFMGLDATEYPPRAKNDPSAVEIKIPGDILAEGLETTIYGVSTEIIRPVMTGILIDIEPERMTCVSSDTRKLVKFETTKVVTGIETSFILPAKAANVLKGLIDKDEEVTVTQDSKSATFTFGTYELFTRLIKGNYPLYRRVFPKNNPFRLVVSREGLLKAVRRCALFANQASSLIKFRIRPSEIQLNSQDLDTATSAEERLDCDYEGKEMTIGLNYVHMIEMLSNLKGEDVLVELSDPARPGLFSPLEKVEGIDVVVLQMPMQVVE